MKKLNKYLWLAVILLSLPVFIIVWANEGFFQGKAYMLLFTAILGAWGFGFKELKQVFKRKK